MIRAKYIGFFLFALPVIGFGQETDLGAWNSITIESDLSKDFKVGLETELRLDNNMTIPYLFFFSPYGEYDLNKHIRFGAGYRYSYHLTDSDRSHRATAEIVFRNLTEFFMKKPRLDASIRLRGTREAFNLARTESTLRTKLSLSYNLPKTKLEPKAAVEFFYEFDQQLVYTFEDVKGVSGWDKYRIRIGVSYPFKKRHELFPFYQFQSGFNEASIGNTLGLAYVYDFKWK